MEGRHTGGKKKDDGDKLSRELTNAVRWCVPLRSMKLFACSVFNYLHQDFDTAYCKKLRQDSATALS